MRPRGSSQTSGGTPRADMNTPSTGFVRRHAFDRILERRDHLCRIMKSRRQVDEDQRIDIGIGGGDLNGARILFRSRRGNHVDGIGQPRLHGQERAQLLFGAAGVLGQDQAIRLAGIGEKDSGAAGVGDRRPHGARPAAVGSTEAG